VTDPVEGVGSDRRDLQRVESVDDPRLADFRELRNPPSGRVKNEECFVVEGQLVVGRLLASDFCVRSLIIQEGRQISTIGAVDPGTHVYRLSRDQICELTGYDFHRGFLASAARKPIGRLDEFQSDPISLAVVQGTDMQNLGGMLRSAAAFGIRQVLIDRQSVDPYARRTMRVSMGAALGMRFLSLENPAGNLLQLASRGVISLAATPAQDSIKICDVKTGDQPVVIVMGNEAQGLPRDVQEAATERVAIAMATAQSRGQFVDSLNVSVAAAILMHELSKRGNA
jgi:tRNA G18 (ribose-2'-O)-methylase SpoU